MLPSQRLRRGGRARRMTIVDHRSEAGRDVGDALIRTGGALPRHQCVDHLLDRNALGGGHIGDGLPGAELRDEVCGCHAEDCGECPISEVPTASVPSPVAGQAAIANVATTATNRNTLIAAQWSKLASVAPPAIRADVASIDTAYIKAATQTGSAATTTLGSISTPAQHLRTFTTSNCAGSGRTAPDPAALAAFTNCLAKNGVAVPKESGQATNSSTAGTSQGGGFGALRNDPKFQTAFAACRSQLPAGGFGGAIRACLSAKGITLPPRDPNSTSPASANANPNRDGNGNGQGRRGGLSSTDPKIQAAIDACRASVGNNAATTIK